MKKYNCFKPFAGIVLLSVLAGPALAGNISGKATVKGLRSPADILVYLTGAPPMPLDLSQARFVMDQQNLTFMPHVLPVPVGATVYFPNNDKVDHSVFSLSRTKQFNLGTYKRGESKTVRFDKPGIVELRCDMHAEMLAYILVLKNPFFAVTDAKGRFEIPSAEYLEKIGITGSESIFQALSQALSPGKYAVKTWHEKLKTKKQTVTVPESGALSIQLSLTRGTPGVLYKR